MGTQSTHSFHRTYGPAPLFDHARSTLREWTAGGVLLSGEHVRRRMRERRIPRAAFQDFDASVWEIGGVNLVGPAHTIHSLVVRRLLAPGLWHGAVLAREHVITTWLDETSWTTARSRRIVRRGELWDEVKALYDGLLCQQVRERSPAIAS